jgi:hypothetical protein
MIDKLTPLTLQPPEEGFVSIIKLATKLEVVLQNFFKS